MNWEDVKEYLGVKTLKLILVTQIVFLNAFCFFDEVATSAQEKENELFNLLDVKSKDALAERKDVIDALQAEHYDVVYIIGHSLGEADFSVFDAINKDAHVIYFYHTEAERNIRAATLQRLGLSFEMISDQALYS